LIASEENVAIAKKLFAAFSEGGVGALLDLLHPDVIAHPSIDGGPTLEGRDALESWWSAVAGRGTEVEARPLDYELHGDWVVVRGYLRYRDGHTLAENQTFWLYEIREGLVTRMETRPSRAAALELIEAG
jgi:ketosteroid isomerase-like protein